MNNYKGKIKLFVSSLLLEIALQSKKEISLKELKECSINKRIFQHLNNYTKKVRNGNISIPYDFSRYQESQINFSQSQVFAIEDSIIVSSPPIIIPQQGKYLIEHLDYNKVNKYNVAKSYSFQGIMSLVKSSPRKKTVINNKDVLLLDFMKATTFFHWVMDGLTKVALFMELFPESKEFQVICPISRLSWQLESLEALGLSREQLLFVDQNPFFMERLWIADYVRENPQFYPNDIVDILSKKIFKNVIANSTSIETPPLIYIKRKLASGRAIVNEQELIQSLKKFGFVDYYLEDMNFYKQVQLFYNAKVVIAPHGAGLTNLIFSKSNTKILELFGDYLNPVFYKMSSAKGMDYFLFKGKDADCKDSRRNNFYIDVSALESFLVRNDLI